ncbi:MAG: hypothetical protein C5B60_07210 [Chloroflexi bacterium]|nr:MAG: hypothetical protein C5B60_07210 [Chloroflexota bacterium]
MKRVVFITPSLKLGGAERSLVKTVVAIREFVEGVDVIVMSSASTEMIAEIPEGTTLHVLGCCTSASPLGWIRARRLLRSLKPHAVVGWSTYANLFAITVTRGLDIPLLAVSERNYFPEIVSAADVSFSRRYLMVLLMRTLYRKADVVTANSYDSLRFLKKFLGRGPQYAQLPNTISVEEANVCAQVIPEVVPKPFDGPRLLAIGRLQPQKGFDLLLKALAEVRMLHPWHLVLVGDGPQRAALQTLARRLNIEHAIQWISTVRNPFPYYQWADLIIIPSRFEGFPNVALEAMSCGKTVICSNCKTGPKELTCDGRFGVLVPAGDTTALARAIIDWGSDPDRRTLMGSKAHDHICAVYDIGRMREVIARALSLAA